jgi:hypothetical protein
LPVTIGTFAGECHCDGISLSMHILPIAVVVALLAQEVAPPASPGTFGCGAPDEAVRTDFYENPAAHFTVVSPPAGREEWMHRKFDGFDRRKYGISIVEFFLNPVTTKGYSGNWEDEPSKITGMQLYVHVTDASASRGRWYVLEGGTNDREEGLLFVQPNKSKTEESPPQGDEETPAQDPLDDWVNLELATPDSGLPIFTLVDQYSDHGANAGGTIGNNLLIDLRSGEPILRAAAQCIHWEGGGACTAPDTAAVHYQHTYCTWQTEESDFLCTATGPWGGSYNPVSAKREFFLLREKAPAELTWAPAALPSLESFVSEFRSKTTGRALVRGVGYVDLIWKSDSLLPGKQLLLLASPGAGDEDNARFTSATVSRDGEVSLVAVPKWSIGGEESDDGVAPEGFTPSDGNIIVTATEFAQSSGAHLLKAVDVRTTGGTSIHVMYLIGMQVKDGNLVTNAVRLASEGTVYQSCGFEAADATALNFHWMAEENAATIRVQPHEASTVEGGTESCPWEGNLRWVDGVGFRVRKIRDLCGLAPTDVAIDDWGEITTKARVREQ